MSGQKDNLYLVAPFWAVSPFTGAGQRTNVFFEALKRLGPVEVIILGKEGTELVPAYFPGARQIHFIDDGGVFGGAGGLKAQLRRSVFLRETYRASKSIGNALAAIYDAAGSARSGKTVVFRYFRTFCVSGAPDSTDPNLRSFVDVDDRDDQRLMSSLTQMNIPARGVALRAAGVTFIPWLRRIMAEKLSRADLVWFAAREDREDFAYLEPEVVENVPYSVDRADDILPPSGSEGILFVGAFGHRPNANGIRWFLNNCWPALQTTYPELKFRIVGSGDWGSLREEFPGIANVDFVGRVEKLAPEYERARMVISPVFEGGGSKIKVIEACAYRRPLVVTSHSVRGFGNDINGAILQADTADEFVAHCRTFIDNPSLADEAGTALREMQVANFSRLATEEKIAKSVRDVWS